MSLARVVALPVRHVGHEPYLSKQQLGGILGYSTRWVELRMNEGMPFHRLGARARFRLSEVEGWLEGRNSGR